MRRLVRKGTDTAPAELTATDGGVGPCGADATRAEDPPAPRSPRPAGRGLQWSAATLAFLAFAASVYSLAQSDAGTTILRERVVETVTVTTERSSLPVAQSGSSGVAAVTGLSGGQDASTTTTTVGGDPSTSSVSTTVGSGDTTTTLP
jgi:hypothetical protein